MHWRPELCPDSTRGAYSAPPDLLAGFWGGKIGKGKGRKDRKEGRKRGNKRGRVEGKEQKRRAGRGK